MMSAAPILATWTAKKNKKRSTVFIVFLYTAFLQHTPACWSWDLPISTIAASFIIEKITGDGAPNPSQQNNSRKNWCNPAFHRQFLQAFQCFFLTSQQPCNTTPGPKGSQQPLGAHQPLLPGQPAAVTLMEANHPTKAANTLWPGPASSKPAPWSLRWSLMPPTFHDNKPT